MEGMLMQQGYLTARTMEEDSRARGASSGLALFKAVGGSLEASRNFSHSLYFTFTGRFMLLREESSDTARTQFANFNSCHVFISFPCAFDRFCSQALESLQLMSSIFTLA